MSSETKSTYVNRHRLKLAMCIGVTIPVIFIGAVRTASTRSKPATEILKLSSGRLFKSAHQSSLSIVEGCVSCHGQIEPMHKYGSTEMLTQLKDGEDAVGLTCTACHGGNPTARKTSDDVKEIDRVKRMAHVQPRFPDEWKREGKSTGGNPERSNTLLERESWEYVRFINPGDLRVAERTCGSSECHAVEQKNVGRSMMAHGAMLWGAALYNNGSMPIKDASFAESYSAAGKPQRLIQTP